MNSSLDQEVLKDFGLRMKKARLDKGLSQEKLASEAETSDTTIYRIEKGKVSAKFDTIARIVDAMGMELNLIDKEK